jgi:predicted  nucleic acid-binding Zn-ribbon protein
MDRLLCYHDSPIRKDWDNPSETEIAESLKKAHAVNRRLVETVNELYDAKKSMKTEIEGLRDKLGKSRTKTEVLSSILTSAVTSAIIGALLAFAGHFVHK